MLDSTPIETSIQRIYIIGMMGVGKSTMGKQLAKHLHYSFLDLDKEIEKQSNQTIAQLFEQHGEQYFRELEQQVLQETHLQNHVVVSTGGGTACFYDNIEWMNAHGKTIYFKANAPFILSRIITNPSKRPLLKGKTQDELVHYISELLVLREPMYNQAKVTIDLPVKSVLDIVKSMA